MILRTNHLQYPNLLEARIQELQIYEEGFQKYLRTLNFYDQKNTIGYSWKCVSFCNTSLAYTKLSFINLFE